MQAALPTGPAFTRPYYDLPGRCGRQRATRNFSMEPCLAVGLPRRNVACASLPLKSRSG